MAINGVEIKVGQVWQTRAGSTATVVSNDNHEYYPWDIAIEGRVGMASCDNEGFIWDSDSPEGDDLVFLVSDPEIGTERRQRQSENSPLRRKDDFPPVPADLPDLAAPPAEFAASIPGVFDSDAFDGSAVSNALDRLCETAKVLDAAGIPAGSVPPHSPRRGMSEPGPMRKLVEDAMGYIDPSKSALDVQIGGGHYKQFAIQPVEFIHKNGIPFIEGNCIKYLARWRDKGGIEDLKKVKHYIDLLIEMESKK